MAKAKSTITAKEAVLEVMKEDRKRVKAKGQMHSQAFADQRTFTKVQTAIRNETDAYFAKIHEENILACDRRIARYKQSDEISSR